MWYALKSSHRTKMKQVTTLLLKELTQTTGGQIWGFSSWFDMTSGEVDADLSGILAELWKDKMTLKQ